MTRLVFCLNAKNEAKVLSRWVESIKPFAHAAVLVDTGSTDRTIDVFVKSCAKASIPFRISKRVWVNFAFNQTELLRIAGQHFPGTYLWNLDADETVQAPAGFSLPELVHDGYRVCRLWGGTYEGWGIRIFKTGARWQYVGERHATPRLDGASIGRLDGIDVVNHRDNTNGTLDAAEQAARFSRDAELFRDKLKANPNDTRSAYYLAQSLKDAGRLFEALDAYQARAAMGGFVEERYVSLLEIARLKWRVAMSDSEVEAAYRAAIADRPQRNEARVELCRLLRSAKRHADAYSLAFDAVETKKPEDTWLVERGAYSWRPLFELAVASWYVGRKADSEALHRTLLIHPELPTPERRLVQQNIERFFTEPGQQAAAAL